MAENKPIEVAGQKFKSIKEASQALGVHPGSAGRWLRMGWTAEQAFGVDAKPESKKEAPNAITMKTKIGSFTSIRAASNATGIQEPTISQRLRLG
jgi:hypothetical protein